MEDGFLYRIFKYILDNVRHLTIVEWLKKLGIYFWCRKTNDKQKLTNCRSNVVDGFNVFKWFLIILLFKINADNYLTAIIVWYFLITNLYSYFYHHIWSDNAIELNLISVDRARRRFFLLLLAFSYSEFCFSYLYKFTYHSEYDWHGRITTLKAVWYSVSSSFAANYSLVEPISELGHSISMIQLIITFIFVTIIISKSIPQVNKD